MIDAALGLGSNLGDRVDNLAKAVVVIRAFSDVELRAVSPVFETSPVGGPKEQGSYLNMAVSLVTSLSARALLDRVLAVELRLGRDRRNEVRWGPRTLDIDLLLYGDHMIDEPGLTVPHPRIASRGFVLYPLNAVAPHVGVPGTSGRTVADLLAEWNAERKDRADWTVAPIREDGAATQVVTAALTQPAGDDEEESK